MQKKIESREEAESMLHMLSERCIQNIQKTIAIHFKIDPPNNKLNNSDDDRLYHMRKVLMHAGMVMFLDDHNISLHAIAVECRVAQEQLDILLGKNLKYSPYDILSPYIHPSPALLIHPQSLGGLATDDSIRILAYRFTMIREFGMKYAYSLSLVINDLYKDLGTEIQNIESDYIEMATHLPPVQEFSKFFSR